MREVVEFLRANDAYFLFGLSVLSLILLIVCISLSSKLSKLNRRRNAKLEEGRLGDILDCLMDQSASLAKVSARLDEISMRQDEQQEALKQSLSNLGIVRYNAFADIGGEQSFAVALLDSNRNGVVLSSVYGRQDSRVYAKAISNGQAERQLSDEEQQALAKALK